jgi:2-succinyl-5-enolpyruvyl-6-hydroxy-3-cyclohexene-1-carboxylate synthase
MPHPKQHIRDLAEICKKKGVEKIIISPGSRSAPIINAFVDTFGEACISIVDERSAAYFALGVAVQSGKLVAIICTSGTAVLNYAPALAEAYYQHIPILAITADRPHEWIDQQDNQTLRQNNIYKNFTLGSYELPQYIAHEDDLWFAQRIINEAICLCEGTPKGPVQINVPLTDPLYGDLPEASPVKIISRVVPGFSVELPDEMLKEWKNATRIMIIHGQDTPNHEMKNVFEKLLNDKRIVVLAENISNIPLNNTISNSNLALSVNRGNSPEYPDLILHSGGQVVSKALTGYLRKAYGIPCWRIGIDHNIIDTYQLVTRFIPYPAMAVYKALSSFKGKQSTGYQNNWIKMSANADKLGVQRISQLPFCDVQAFKVIMESIPEKSLVALGNSSVIRYSQLFPVKNNIEYFSNRGISGIDGCLSTAAGIAHASAKLTIAITGDLGFLYDSNALWNNELPSNLRIVVLNNQGGGIFHIIKGPSEQPGFKKFIEANHPVNISKLAEAYGLKYLYADDALSVTSQWSEFSGSQKTAAIFEIRTDAEISAQSFRQLMVSQL